MTLQEFFTDESKWCKIFNFKDENNKIVEIKYPVSEYGVVDIHSDYLNPLFDRSKVKSCCLWGAVLYCYESRSDRILVTTKIHKYIELKYGIYSMCVWNDFNATFEDIVKMVADLNI